MFCSHSLLPTLTAVALLASPTTHAGILVATNSMWVYRPATNEASTPTTAWRLATFDATLWPQGRAPFHFGEGLQGGTVLNSMRSNYSGIFLRQTIQVADPTAIGLLRLRVLSDDGFVAWFNGREVARQNVTATTLTFRTLASAAAAEPLTLLEFVVPNLSNLVVKGTNALAVQALNQTLAGSDFRFDLQLESIPPDVVAPRVVSVTPSPSKVKDLSELTVRFSEPVTGVGASDLLVNGLAATEVTGTGAEYKFRLPTLGTSVAVVTWEPAHDITDRGFPSNPFDDSTSGAPWVYEVQDLKPPTVQSQHPKAGARVSQLTQVEVVFSEPVQGVDAADLVINGVPAAGVEGVAAGPYVFRFPQPAAGSVRLSWRFGHGITDFAQPANLFPGGIWSVTLDPAAAPGQVRLNEMLCVNLTGLKDEDGEASSWIELYNAGTNTVNLAGWSLTDDARLPGKWVFPAYDLPAKRFLVVFASGKDRYVATTSLRFHTNFKLSTRGEYLGLYSPDSPRRVVDELSPEYPDQRANYSYGRGSDGGWRYLLPPTPNAANPASSLVNALVDPPHFSVPRGVFGAPFQLTLACATAGATIRYTTNGSEPTEANGFPYSQPIDIRATTIVRAAAFLPEALPSRVITHSYFLGQTSPRLSLPILSLVTASNNLRGPTGIMESSPRNTTKRGIAWERPVSAEWIRPEDNGGFQVDCGLRVAGGDYIRARYTPTGSPPDGKYSFRLFFRGDYGTGKLDYPLFGDSPVHTFDRIVLRAGMNDPTNPFIVDEMMRRLLIRTGQVCARGTVVNLFLNGSYKGYYNPTEAYEEDFFQAWHGGEAPWDIQAQFGEIVAGDAVAWNALRGYLIAADVTQGQYYNEIARQLDLVNFIDYLLVNVYGGTGDWPNNNFRAARERSADAKFRFYIWDAEWALGNSGRSPTLNTFTSELAIESDIGTFYRKLRGSPEFRLLFADRIHRHLFNNGALMDQQITNAFQELKTTMAGVLPNLTTTIPRTWIPQRRKNIMTHFAQQGLLASSNAPSFSQHGGRVPWGYALTLTATNGTIYYTTNGSDPRLPHTGAIAADALTYTNGTALSLRHDLTLIARTLYTNAWSARTEAQFQVARLGLPVRITEIMYHPPGGEAFEFVEIQNVGDDDVDLSGGSVEGLGYVFPFPTVLGPGAVLLLASDLDPAAFRQRYPTAQVYGYYPGSLANGGERIALRDRAGETIVSVDFRDADGWPTAADGEGYSLVNTDPTGDPDAPSSWRSSSAKGGTPGLTSPPPPSPAVRLNELYVPPADRASADAGWVELVNDSSLPVDLTKWRLWHSRSNELLTFPAGTVIAPGAFLVVDFGVTPNRAALHTDFPLASEGGDLHVLDPQGGCADGIRYGQLAGGFSLGRLDGTWAAATPTPGETNRPALLGRPSGLAINEWLANARPGESDWIELFNRDLRLPVDLFGVWVQSSNRLCQILTHIFVAPGGLIRLWADEQPGPDHLDLRLPAEGARLALLEATGAQIDSVTFGAQAENVSQGRLPDGSQTIVSFPLSATPGSANQRLDARGARLHELMARNEGVTRSPTGAVCDWIELRNTNATPWDMTGCRLLLEEAGLRWSFPATVRVPARGYLIIWMDPARAASTQADADLNAGFALPDAGATLVLQEASGRLIDRVPYGFQLKNQSLGVADNAWALLETPTPGRANAPAASLGPVTELRFNEWMAAPTRGADWIELLNQSASPVALTGLFVTADVSLSGRTNSQVGPLSYVGANDRIVWHADGQTDLGHLPFALDARGGNLRLYTPDLGLLDAIDYAQQSEGVSGGRFPDGGSAIVAFADTASPGQPNFLPAQDAVFSEVLPHSDGGPESAIELHNPTPDQVDLSGWYLSDDEASPLKYRFPDGTCIEPFGYLVVPEAEFNAPSLGAKAFRLKARSGAKVVLTQNHPLAGLKGYRTTVQLPPVEAGVSIGRYVESTATDQFPWPHGTEFVPLDHPTLATPGSLHAGHPDAATTPHNAYPRVGPVVVSEIMYHPPASLAASGQDPSLFEFIELWNLTDQPMRLGSACGEGSSWRISGGVQFEFRAETVLPAHAGLLVVSFDPDNASDRQAFQAAYGLNEPSVLCGPMKGRLANAGDAIQLDQPACPPIAAAAGSDTATSFAVERVDFHDHAPWPRQPDGGGASLQRRNLTDFGNDPASWIAAPPTPGRRLATWADTDTDGDGLPDRWEELHSLSADRASDADQDSDGDGVSNLLEYRGGTRPHDARSRLGILRVAATGGEVALLFECAAGRSYTVERCDGLGGNSWVSAAEVPSASHGGYTEVRLSANVATGYYRLVAH